MKKALSLQASGLRAPSNPARTAFRSPGRRGPAGGRTGSGETRGPAPGGPGDAKPCTFHHPVAGSPVPLSPAPFYS